MSTTPTDARELARKLKPAAKIFGVTYVDLPNTLQSAARALDEMAGEIERLRHALLGGDMALTNIFDAQDAQLAHLRDLLASVAPDDGAHFPGCLASYDKNAACDCRAEEIREAIRETPTPGANP